MDPAMPTPEEQLRSLDRGVSPYAQMIDSIREQASRLVTARRLLASLISCQMGEAGRVPPILDGGLLIDNVLAPVLGQREFRSFDGFLRSFTQACYAKTPETMEEQWAAVANGNPPRLPYGSEVFRAA